MPTPSAPARRVATVLALVLGCTVAVAADVDCRALRTDQTAPHHEPGGEFKGERLLWNSGTGADRRNYPPDRVVDFEHMKLEIDIPDMNIPELTARETLTFTPIGAPVASLGLNAHNFEIRSVELVGGGKADYAYDGDRLQLTFAPPLVPGATSELRIAYALRDPADGLFWTLESSAWPGRPAQIHTQGEADTNSYWFACHDFPNERLSTELVVTVPEGFVVSSNGRMADQPKTRDHRTTFHWIQERPHANYLVSLCVGKWDVVDVGRGQLDMPVYAPVGKGPLVEKTYGRTLDMIRAYEDRFGVKYPWARYAQVVVWNFGAGGMENTSATTMYDTAIYDDKAFLDGDMDGLISHELGHQWFGDLITCDSWAHIWLNEGFATYATALWYEKRDGHDAGYLWDMYDNVRGAARRDRLDPDDPNAGMRPGMVSRVYDNPDDVFGRTSNPYPKGASILHMLRATLGDDVFFKGLQTYVARFQGRTAETDDFRKVMEEVSGRSLERFFQQWAYRPGTPEVTVTSKWDAADKRLKLVVEQTQRVDALVPAFAFTLPVLIESGGKTQTVSVEVDGLRHERAIPLAAEPTMVVVDPELTVLMTPKLKQPTGWLIEQLRRGPTVVARLDAADALGRRDEPRVVEALVAVVRNTSEHHAVREQAAESLGNLKKDGELLKLYHDGGASDDARPRRAIVQAMGVAVATGSPAVAAVAGIASNESESYGVRSAALRALGKVGSRENLDVLIRALDSVSQHDQVRSAALAALGELDVAEGLDAAIKYTRPGYLSRLRPVAIAAVAEMADHDRDKAVLAILPLLTDHEPRTRAAACRALVTIKSEKALPELRRLAGAARDPRSRQLAGDSADALAAALAKDDSVRDVRQELNRVRREVEKLKGVEKEDK